MYSYKNKQNVDESSQWLHIKNRIHFRILLVSYKALNALQYIKYMLRSYTPTRLLRFMGSGNMAIRQGEAAFCLYISQQWNVLPADLREVSYSGLFQTQAKFLHLHSNLWLSSYCAWRVCACVHLYLPCFNIVYKLCVVHINHSMLLYAWQKKYR